MTGESIKKCSTCGIEKPLGEYYFVRRRGTYEARCKKCTIAKTREYKQKYPEVDRAWREANRDKVGESTRKARKKYEERNREKIRAYQLEYRHSEAGRNVSRRWKQRNPRKHAAHSLVRSALRDGRLAKEPCWVCGSQKVQAHHPDYDKPLWVYWLCKRCHTKLHRRMAEREQKKSHGSSVQDPPVD